MIRRIVQNNDTFDLCQAGLFLLGAWWPTFTPARRQWRPKLVWTVCRRDDGCFKPLYFVEMEMEIVSDCIISSSLCSYSRRRKYHRALVRLISACSFFSLTATFSSLVSSSHSLL